MQQPIILYNNTIGIKSIENFCILCFWLDSTFFISSAYYKTIAKKHLLIYKYIELVAHILIACNSNLFICLYIRYLCICHNFEYLEDQIIIVCQGHVLKSFMRSFTNL